MNRGLTLILVLIIAMILRPWFGVKAGSRIRVKALMGQDPTGSVWPFRSSPTTGNSRSA